MGVQMGTHFHHKNEYAKPKEYTQTQTQTQSPTKTTNIIAMMKSAN